MAPECHPEPFAFCHPERSEGSRPTQGRLREGSQVLENTRFFALLRMTDRLDKGFFSGINNEIPGYRGSLGQDGLGSKNT